MKKMRMLAIGLLALTGCATPMSPVLETNRTFHEPYDRIWSGAVAGISGDYPFKIVAKDSGVIETEMINFAGDAHYASAPMVLLGVWEQTRCRLSCYVRSLDSEN